MNNLMHFILTRFILTFVLVFFPIASVFCAYQNHDKVNMFVEYLVHEKINLTISLNEAKLFSLPKNETDYDQLLKVNTEKIILNKAKINSLENFLINQKKNQTNLNESLKILQQKSISQTTQINSLERIGEISNLVSINNKTISLIEENIVLAKKLQNVLILQKERLRLWHSKQFKQNSLEKLYEQEKKLNEGLGKLYATNIKLYQDAKDNKNTTTDNNIETKLLLNNQLISITQYKLVELDLQKKLIDVNYLFAKNPDLKALQKTTETYKEVIAQLTEIDGSFKKMAGLLINEELNLQNNNLKQQLITLLSMVKAHSENLTIQQQTLQEDLENYQQELKKQLSTRQSLAEYRLDSLPYIFKQIAAIPVEFYNYCKLLIFKIRDNYLWQDVLPNALIWLTITAIFLVTYGFHRLLQYLISDKERFRFSGHLYEGTLTIINRNLLQISTIIAAVTVFYLNHIAFANYQLLLNLAFVWLTFRTLILIARLSLLERLSDSSGKDVQFYYRIRRLLLLGGWITALMVISNELNASLLLQDLLNRVFILFLLFIAIASWRSKDFFLHLLEPILENNKKYFHNAAMLLIVLIPLTLLTTAVIGLSGYMNMAWTMSRYQFQLLLIMAGYVLIRGLAADALELLAEWMISSLQNGWLWIEVLLKPLAKIMRVALFALSVLVLAQLFGWYSDPAIMAKIVKYIKFPLVNFSGIYITALSFLEFVLLLSIFAWVAKWTREFCYRWLYREISDSGIRNSLAVFTQYTVVLVGFVIALRVLGVDFSGMSMVLGGLAVGMGFGLRDFASNIIGGLMLLIERPVREGDLITLGTYEGKVNHIGIRSIRLRSWDNTEILIPNAEIFNKPFTNWTHQDAIVRTILPIKVSRADDPAMVQQIISEVLDAIPEIEDKPSKQVLLKQINDALIEFEVRYFVNVQLYLRAEIRSKVLLAITEKFKIMGITAPIPPISIELKELNKIANEGKMLTKNLVDERV